MFEALDHDLQELEDHDMHKVPACKYNLRSISNLQLSRTFKKPLRLMEPEQEPKTPTRTPDSLSELI
jgi:hypothetical protein